MEEAKKKKQEPQKLVNDKGDIITMYPDGSADIWLKGSKQTHNVQNVKQLNDFLEALYGMPDDEAEPEKEPEKEPKMPSDVLAGPKMASDIMAFLSDKGLLTPQGSIHPHKKVYAIKHFREYIEGYSGQKVGLYNAKITMENLPAFLDYVKTNGIPKMDKDSNDYPELLFQWIKDHSQKTTDEESSEFSQNEMDLLHDLSVKYPGVKFTTEFGAVYFIVYSKSKGGDASESYSQSRSVKKEKGVYIISKAESKSGGGVSWEPYTTFSNFPHLYNHLEIAFAKSPIKKTSSKKSSGLTQEEKDWVEAFIATNKSELEVHQWADGTVGVYDPLGKAEDKDVGSPLFIISKNPSATYTIRYFTLPQGAQWSYQEEQTFEDVIYYLQNNLEKLVAVAQKGDEHISMLDELPEALLQGGFNFLGDIDDVQGKGKQYKNDEYDQILYFDDGSASVMKEKEGVWHSLQTTNQLVKWLQKNYGTGGNVKLKLLDMFSKLNFKEQGTSPTGDGSVWLTPGDDDLEIFDNGEVSFTPHWESEFQPAEELVFDNLQQFMKFLSLRSSGSDKIKVSFLANALKEAGFESTTDDLPDHLLSKYQETYAHPDTGDRVLLLKDWDGIYQSKPTSDGTSQIDGMYANLIDLAYVVKKHHGGFAETKWSPTNGSTGDEELDELIKGAEFIYQGTDDHGTSLVYLKKDLARLKIFEDGASVHVPISGTTHGFNDYASLKDFLYSVYMGKKGTASKPTFPSVLDYKEAQPVITQDLKLKEWGVPEFAFDSISFQHNTPTNMGLGEIMVESGMHLVFAIGQEATNIVDSGKLWYIRCPLPKGESKYTFTTKNNLLTWLKENIMKIVKKVPVDTEESPTESKAEPPPAIGLPKHSYPVTTKLLEPVHNAGFKVEQNAKGIFYEHPSGFWFQLFDDRIFWSYKYGTKEWLVSKDEHEESLLKIMAQIVPQMANTHDIDKIFDTETESRQQKMFAVLLKTVKALNGIYLENIAEDMVSNDFEWDEGHRAFVNYDLSQALSIVPTFGTSYHLYWINSAGSIAHTQLNDFKQILGLIGPKGTLSKIHTGIKILSDEKEMVPSGQTYKSHDQQPNAKLIKLNPHDENILKKCGFKWTPEHNHFYENGDGNVLSFDDTGKAYHVEVGSGVSTPFDSIPETLKFAIAKYTGEKDTSTSIEPPKQSIIGAGEVWSGKNYDEEPTDEELEPIYLNEQDEAVLNSLGFEKAGTGKDKHYIKFLTANETPKITGLDEAKKKKKKDPNQGELPLGDPEKDPVVKSKKKKTSDYIKHIAQQYELYPTGAVNPTIHSPESMIGGSTLGPLGDDPGEMPPDDPTKQPKDPYDFDDVEGEEDALEHEVLYCYNSGNADWTRYIETGTPKDKELETKDGTIYEMLDFIWSRWKHLVEGKTSATKPMTDVEKFAEEVLSNYNYNTIETDKVQKPIPLVEMDAKVLEDIGFKFSDKEGYPQYVKDPHERFTAYNDDTAYYLGPLAPNGTLFFSGVHVGMKMLLKHYFTKEDPGVQAKEEVHKELMAYGFEFKDGEYTAGDKGTNSHQVIRFNQDGHIYYRWYSQMGAEEWAGNNPTLLLNQVEANHVGSVKSAAKTFWLVPFGTGTFAKPTGKALKSIETQLGELGFLWDDTEGFFNMLDPDINHQEVKFYANGQIAFDYTDQSGKIASKFSTDYEEVYEFVKKFNDAINFVGNQPKSFSYGQKSTHEKMFIEAGFDWDGDIRAYVKDWPDPLMWQAIVFGYDGPNYAYFYPVKKGTSRKTFKSPNPLAVVNLIGKVEVVRAYEKLEEMGYKRLEDLITKTVEGKQSLVEYRKDGTNEGIILMSSGNVWYGTYAQLPNDGSLVFNPSMKYANVKSAVDTLSAYPTGTTKPIKHPKINKINKKIKPGVAAPEIGKLMLKTLGFKYEKEFVNNKGEPIVQYVSKDDHKEVNIGLSGKVTYHWLYGIDPEFTNKAWGTTVFSTWQDFKNFAHNQTFIPPTSAYNKSDTPLPAHTPFLQNTTLTSAFYSPEKLFPPSKLPDPPPLIQVPPSPYSPPAEPVKEMPWSGFDYAGWGVKSKNDPARTIRLMSTDEKLMGEMGFELRADANEAFYYQNKKGDKVKFFVSGKSEITNSNGESLVAKPDVEGAMRYFWLHHLADKKAAEPPKSQAALDMPYSGIDYVARSKQENIAPNQSRHLLPFDDAVMKKMGFEAMFQPPVKFGTYWYAKKGFSIMFYGSGKVDVWSDKGTYLIGFPTVLEGMEWLWKEWKKSKTPMKENLYKEIMTAMC